MCIKCEEPVYCKGMCKKHYHADYFQRNKERAYAVAREYQLAHPEQRARTLRKNHVKRRYGVAIEVEEHLWAEQDGKCAICDSALSAGNRQIDHCHATGAIRGLLCSACNWGLGNFKDDTNRLQKAMEYLDGFARKI